MATNTLTEEQEQICVFDWIRVNPAILPFAFHIANERKATAHYGKKLKRLGVKSGVSDIFIAIPRATYSGLFLEMKSSTGKLTRNQNLFLSNMAKSGYAVIVAYSATAAIDGIKNYLFGNHINAHPWAN